MSFFCPYTTCPILQNERLQRPFAILRTDDIEKPKTNADRIRSMSDEELAEFIGKFCDCQLGDCPITTSSYNCSENGCKGSWLKWLRRKVTE